MRLVISRLPNIPLKALHYPLQPELVHFVEGVVMLAVNIEHADDLAIAEHRHHNFAVGSAAAGDVALELVHIGNHQRALLLPGGSAYTAPVGDARARQRSLERT